MTKEFKAVPFIAKITRNDNSEKVAEQIQNLIDENSENGWNYLRLESVQTYIAADNGCFGIGAQPATTTTFRVIIFERNIK